MESCKAGGWFVMGGAVTAVEFLFYCITVGEEVRHSRGSCRTAIDEDFVVELW